jgi:Kef-type K+ transport system membrane component KefB
MSSLYVAAVLAVVVLVASVFSVELGLSVAIIEIVAGAVVGNTLHLATPDWLVFLAGFGSVVLTFLAGAEVDPAHLRATLKPSLLIGILSFAAPFVGALVVCRYGFDWDWKAAQIGGIALSTTSLAVVYAVLVETGLNATHIGKLIMSATFVSDLGTVLALSVLFISPNWWLIPFVLVSVVLIVVMPRLAGWFFARYGSRVIEPEIKGAFAALLVLMWLGEQAHSHAVLPAFLLGLAVSRTFHRHRATQQRFRVVAFALLTPFFFLRSGMNVSLPLVTANVGLLGALLALKLATKTVAVYPPARRCARHLHRRPRRHHHQLLTPLRTDQHRPAIPDRTAGRSHKHMAAGRQKWRTWPRSQVSHQIALNLDHPQRGQQRPHRAADRTSRPPRPSHHPHPIPQHDHRPNPRRAHRNQPPATT